MTSALVGQADLRNLTERRVRLFRGQSCRHGCKRHAFAGLRPSPGPRTSPFWGVRPLRTSWFDRGHECFTFKCPPIKANGYCTAVDEAPADNPPKKAKNGRPDNSKRPRRIATIFRRLHPRQQCSSAVATERGSKLPFSAERALYGARFPRGSRGGQYCCAGPSGLSGTMPVVRHASFPASRLRPTRDCWILGRPARRPLAR